MHWKCVLSPEIRLETSKWLSPPFPPGSLHPPHSSRLTEKAVGEAVWALSPCSAHTVGKHPNHADVSQPGHLPGGTGWGETRGQGSKRQGTPREASLRVGTPGPWGSGLGGGALVPHCLPHRFGKWQLDFCGSLRTNERWPLHHPKQKCFWKSASAPVTSRESIPGRLGESALTLAGAGLCAQLSGPLYHLWEGAGSWLWGTIQQGREGPDLQQKYCESHTCRSHIQFYVF